MLQKKIVRDVSEHRWPFIAIICICTLGIALFSGFNLYVSTIENELNRVYDRWNLADYWVYKDEITDEELARIQSLPGVTLAERRKTLDLPLRGEENATLRLHGTEGRGTINSPELMSGALLEETDANALLLDSRFAEANGIVPGDTMQLGAGGQQSEWSVKGIVRNVEYAYYAPNGLTIPDYRKYGFAYVSAVDLPQMGYNEIILTADNVVGQMEMTAGIREAVGSVSVISRGYQASVGKIADDLSGNRQIGMLFPIVFFLTAALITWITVGRMMENQRQHLGTLRSLGFSKREIIARYSLYGVLITIPSIAFGWLVSRFIIAQTLYNIATVYYTIDVRGVDLFSPHFFLAVLGVAVVTCGAAYLSCRRTLSFTPAALMRPRPPAAVHRILLERVTPFWKRLSFSGKIVTRNLFRNKVRMAMGVIGITGSAALVLCGFGLMSSINGMIDKSFSEVIRYDAEVKLKTALTIDEIGELVKQVNGTTGFDAALSLGVTVYDRVGTAISPYLVILEDAQSSLNFRDDGGKPVSLPTRGAFITPRMAKALGIGIGNIIEAEGMDGTMFPLEVAGIVDFPVGNEIYMSVSAFAKISDIPFTARVFFLRGNDINIVPLRQDTRVALVEAKEEMRENLNVVLEILQGMQGILIAFSGLLAFAVMMVLGQMNFDERIRELATLKVLGLHKNEMRRLVLRENVWITVMGLPAGIASSFFLLRMVLSLATTPDMEIAPSLSVLGVVIGCALVVAFTLFVNFLMTRKFRGIDMVASLKSVE
jgi:putative ABC transport system permease protein